MGHSRLHSGTGSRSPAFSTQYGFERGKAEEDILSCRRVSEGTDAPDPPLERPEGGTYFDPEILQERVSNPQIIDAIRHKHRIDHGKTVLRRFLTEEP
jgi:hypothetical protein